MMHVNRHGVMAPRDSHGGFWRTFCPDDLPRNTLDVYGPAGDVGGLSLDTVDIHWTAIAVGRRRMGYVAECPRCGQTFTHGSMALAFLEPEFIRELIREQT